MKKYELTNVMKLSSRGQMAIFIVLIFQVLFVFFAMIVNVGVVVHHKINLQNAVDLGAYYAASKQAEVLNAISHYNYQIRQAYKLLSWRNRVLGVGNQSAGSVDRHPFFSPNSYVSDREVEVFFNPKKGHGSPYVCTTWNKWSHILEEEEDFCATLDDNIENPPEFPEPQFPAAPFLPFNMFIYQQMQEQAESFAKSCETYGIHNFQMAALWMRSYREVVRTRVEEIERLARSLSERSFSDIDGGSVFEGTWNTVRHNLTRGNTVKLTESDLRIFNSLENSVTEQGGVRWLKKTLINPRPFYVDSRRINDRTCKPDIKPCNIPSRYADSEMTPDEIQRLQIACQEPREEHNPFRSTIGFEKNPWYMAYVGVEVQVKSIQPFMPFSGGITLTAKAYAKPFGGRIGPWFGKTWPKGAEQSSSLGAQVDALLPVNSYSVSTQLTDGEAIAKAIPNYSRFPGDSLGLKSGMALASMGEAFGREVRDKLSIQDWMNVEGFSSNPAVRNFELASMAPDVFDITYYSIDPHFNYNYPNGQFKDFSAEGISTLSDQIQLSLGLRSPQLPPYIVKDPAHLLTGWAPNQDGHHFNYDFPDGEFGVCQNLTHSRSSPEGLTRHGCPGQGGRAGYSVKLISSEYLNTPQILGGDGSVGQIFNPPSN